jgi:predicted amidohydrolase YtcJ
VPELRASNRQTRGFGERAAVNFVMQGSTADIMRRVDGDTRVLALGGRSVLPGIVDAHTHIFNDAWRIGLDLHGAQALALENGITTLGNLFVTPDFLDEMRRFEADGHLRLRTSLYLSVTDPCGNSLAGDWWQAHPPTRRFGERLRIGGIKMTIDGGVCGSPAVSVEFEPGSGLGDLHMDTGQLEAILAEAEQLGHQGVIHAIGDRAVATAQDAIEAVLEGRTNHLRHRIDHNLLVPEALIARYAEIGIQPVVFGHLAPGVLQRSSTCPAADRNAFYQAYEGNTRMLLERLPAQRVAWHGDDPWIGPVSPFRELYNMVTRIRRFSDGSECSPPDWMLDTRITVEQGLRMMTVNAAHALFRETEVGSLAPGKLADLIVLSADPLSIEPEALWDVEVALTMIGGETVYCRPGHSLCHALASD